MKSFSLKRAIRLFVTLSIVALLFPKTLSQNIFLDRAADLSGTNKSFSSKRAERLARRLESLVQSKSDQIKESILTYTVKKGDTWSRIWENLGFKAEDAILVEALLKGAEGCHILRPGEDLVFNLSDESSSFVSFEKSVSAARKVQVTRSLTGNFDLAFNDLEITESQRTISGIISSSFFTAARNEDTPFSIIDEMVDLLADRVEFSRNLQPGDTFVLVYNERRTPSGELVSAGPIESAAIYNQGHLISAIRSASSDGKAHYFDHSGKVLGNFFLRYPVVFSRISSVFSDARLHPILRRARPHNGVDFAARTGTPVRSIGQGRVEYAGYSSSEGYMIKIKHTKDLGSAYLHLSKIHSSIKKGVAVERGQLIGAVGSTGLATGPHLHFSLFNRGKYIDPLKAELPALVNSDLVIPKVVVAKALQVFESENSKLVFAKNASKDRVG